ncbi:MAG: class I SAM-dependent methyltransferase [Chloroflexi bacterium]|nr:MAG: class I SAM-dependent methyltransferase [Chloroflexota bacterium]
MPARRRSRHGFGRSSFPPRLPARRRRRRRVDMANDNQFKTKTAFVATRGVREYRATIPHVVRPDDSVLEVGCEWGTTTALLARHARSVLGTDVSRECLARAREIHPDVEFRPLDAFDLRAVLDLGRQFTAVYMDLSGLSGYRGLLDLVALLNAYAAVVFATRCRAWSAGEPGADEVDRA